MPMSFVHKYVIVVLILAIIGAFIVNTSITFRPFSIKIQRWEGYVGWIVVALGVMILRYDAKKEYADDLKKALEQEIKRKEIEKWLES